MEKRRSNKREKRGERGVSAKGEDKNRGKQAVAGSTIARRQRMKTGRRQNRVIYQPQQEILTNTDAQQKGVLSRCFILP